MSGKEDRVQATLQKDDVQVVGNKVSMSIRHTKTDQSKRGVDIALSQCSIEAMCPVQAIEALRGKHCRYFFCHSDSCLHSFWLRTAFTEAVLGYSPEDIKRMGCWSSNKF